MKDFRKKIRAEMNFYSAEDKRKDSYELFLMKVWQLLQRRQEFGKIFLIIFEKTEIVIFLQQTKVFLY